jgi:hypothetical protein
MRSLARDRSRRPSALLRRQAGEKLSAAVGQFGVSPRRLTEQSRAMFRRMYSSSFFTYARCFSS